MRYKPPSWNCEYVDSSTMAVPRIATVVGIDAFDGDSVLENPPKPFPSLPAGPARQTLLRNYGGAIIKRRDVRAADSWPAARRRNMFFTHHIVERYQFLLLAKDPLFADSFDGNGLGGMPLGYLAARTQAMRRYTRWMQDAHRPVMPLEVIYYRGDVPLQAPTLALRTNPADPTDRRYRLNITPVGQPPFLYSGPASVRSRRYLYLPPGTPVPRVYQGAGIPFQDVLSQNQDHPKLLYAVGCTCLDFAFRGFDADHEYGCKHTVFWNLCRTREIESGVPKIEWPVGVP